MADGFIQLRQSQAPPQESREEETAPGQSRDTGTLPFPRTQAEMERYQKGENIRFNPQQGAWEKVAPGEIEIPRTISTEDLDTGPPAARSRSEVLSGVSEEVQRIAQEVSGLTQQTERFLGERDIGDEQPPAEEGDEQPPAEEGDEETTTTVDYDKIYDRIADKLEESQAGFLQQVKETLGFGEEQETPTEVINRLYPQLPERVGEIDRRLAQLRTDFQQRTLQAERRPASVGFIRGEKANIQRAYEIRRQGLLLEREAVMGDFERAEKRADRILNIRQQQRDEQRENQFLAIELMKDQADTQQQLMLSALERTLDRQETREERQFQLEKQELSDIRSIINENPEAFIGEGWPRSVEEALGIVGQFKQRRAQAPLTAGRVGGFEVLRGPGGEVVSARFVEGGAEPTTDMERMEVVDDIIEQGRGTDGLVAAETYLQARKAWIGVGGNITDFRSAYPADALMRPFELQRLPQEAKEEVGIEEPTSVSGQKLALKRGLVRDAKTGGEGAPQNRQEAKEIIRGAGFNPDDEDWSNVLSQFPEKGVWTRPWTWF